MITDWLSYSEKSPSPYGLFRVINVVEKLSADQNVCEYMTEEVLSAYRNFDELKFRFENLDAAALKAYLLSNVFPGDDYTLVRNVRQGDFAEVLSSLIVRYFQGLVTPLHKMRYKFNKDRSVFCTDMMAHNSGAVITDLYYYEIKCRLDIRKEKVGDITDYITILAHNSLQKDELTPNEAIADFLSSRHYEQGEYELSAKYNDIVLNANKYNRKFELFFIIEKGNYKEDILVALQDLPATLTPLSVTVVLIENLKTLIEKTYQDALTAATSKILVKKP